LETRWRTRFPTAPTRIVAIVEGRSDKGLTHRIPDTPARNVVIWNRRSEDQEMPVLGENYNS
jgi:hypothetical protein